MMYRVLSHTTIALALSASLQALNPTFSAAQSSIECQDRIRDEHNNCDMEADMMEAYCRADSKYEAWECFTGNYTCLLEDAINCIELGLDPDSPLCLDTNCAGIGSDAFKCMRALTASFKACMALAATYRKTCHDGVDETCPDSSAPGAFVIEPGDSSSLLDTSGGSGSLGTLDPSDSSAPGAFIIESGDSSSLLDTSGGTGSLGTLDNSMW